MSTKEPHCSFWAVVTGDASWSPMALFANDSDLVIALRAGNEEAFGELLDRYDGLLRRIARGFVSSDSIAEEVVGDTWVGVIRGIDRFEGRSSLKTWIIRILTNQAKTRGQRESRSVPFSSVASRDADGQLGGWDPSAFLSDQHQQWPGHFADDVSTWGSRPLEELLSGEAIECASSAAESLPTNQRVVFELRDIQGWTSAEVCEALDLTDGNQRVLLHRARSQVRRALDEYFAMDRP